MGRTARNRKKKQSSILKSTEEDLSVLERMEDWMKSMGWFPTCNLVPYIFPITRRGLKTLEDIEVDSSLAIIPMKLLITTSVVSNSDIKNIFLSNKTYTSQSVLATFLLFERHLGSASKWKCYLNSLPISYTTPDYCKNAEKKILPTILSQELKIQCRKMINDFKTIQESIHELKNTNTNLCYHCGLPFSKIFTFSAYKWAYYTVNTRAVYLDSNKDVHNIINIRGDDNLALAPYLDLFNHTFDASVKVNLIIDKSEEYYHIYTLRCIEKNSQVFINYGTHCNLKLYTEYGFFIPNNPLDEVLVDYCDIKKCVPVSEGANEFIITNKFNKDIGFISTGLNFSAKIVFFILSTSLNTECWKRKLYTYDFNSQDLILVNEVACKILDMKKLDLMNELKKMEEHVNRSESFKIAIDLMKQYVSILNHSFDCITKELLSVENK